MARQPTTSISQPPTNGPMAPATEPAAAQMPMALPRASPEKLLPRMARLVGISIAAPTPCNTRAAINHGRPGAAAHSSDAAANKPTPINNRRRWPKRSPAAPPINSSALNGSR